MKKITILFFTDIVVLVNREGDRTFLDQLKKDGDIQSYNGTNWINYTGSNENTETWFVFTNEKTTRISKLNKGTYQVKVRDSKKCFVR